LLRGLLAVEHDRAQASSLIASLQSRERTYASLSEEEHRALEGAPLVELAMRESFASRYSDRKRMITLAQTARVLADHLSVKRYGRRVVADFRARAWAELGNAYRVADNFNAAKGALGRAAACVKIGTGSSRLIARILFIWTAVLRDLRDFTGSGEMLEFLIPYFWKFGDGQSLVSALIRLSLGYEQDGEPEKAVIITLQALRLIIPDPESPRLLLLAGINALAVNLAGAGDFEIAWAVLQKTRRLYRRSGKLNQYRLCWLEGRIAAGLGNTGLAEAKFNVARRAYSRESLNYESALVSLDLGLVYARQTRHNELVWLVNDMVRTFRALDIGREVLASLILLRKSAEKRFSPESLCVLIESIAATLTELAGRVDGKAA
jgi:tetratricopeptide (TPR) repeat protein